MYKNKAFHLCVAVCIVFSAVVSADPIQCIDWQPSSERIVFQPANGGVWYPRVLELDNGHWLCAYDTKEWSETYTRVCISRSTNQGDTWSSLSQASFGTGNAANGQLTQLPNGDVLCAYRRVNEPTKTLSVSRSTDNGQSWSPLSTIISNTGGVWEPHIIRKDDGQLLVFYAQDEDGGGYDQIIEMMRSDDNGATWRSPQRVSGATWSRDGMPVPAILDNGDILVVLEAHYNPGEPFSIASVRSSDGGDTWGPRQRVHDPPGFAAAPFLVQAPNGQLVVSFQTDDVPSGSGEEMGIVASFDHGNTWYSQPNPFSGADGSNYHWNSLFVEDADTLVAATTAWGVGPDKIKIIKGTLTSPYTITGDFNDSGRVNLHDAAILAAGWLGDYELSDLLQMAANWLVDCWDDAGNPACVPD